jgi:hypothetical protein
MEVTQAAASGIMIGHRVRSWARAPFISPMSHLFRPEMNVRRRAARIRSTRLQPHDMTVGIQVDLSLCPRRFDGSGLGWLLQTFTATRPVHQS